MYDIITVGAGPAGSYFSGLASKNGFKVLQLDLKSEVGIPNHCSGLVNKRIIKYSGEELIIDKPESATIYTPQGCIELKNKDMVVIDRIGLDKKLSKEAVEAGTTLSLNSRFIEFKIENNAITVYYQNRGKLNKASANILVGADGPASNVRKKLGVAEPILLPSIQFDLKKLDSNVKIWLDRRKIKDFFAWEVPQGATSEVGISGRHSINFPYELLNNYPKIEIIKRRGGVIPIGKSVLGAQGIYLIGDAAVANKATTGGGLLGAFKSAEYLMQSLYKEDTLMSYKKLWNSGFGRDIKNAYLLRKIIDKTEFFYNLWYNTFKLSSKIINKVGDVDYPEITAMAILDISLIYSPLLLRYFISDLAQIHNYSRQ
jgi:digeranylgeranylglycerophospholipid reductase